MFLEDVPLLGSADQLNDRTGQPLRNGQRWDRWVENDEGKGAGASTALTL